MRAIRVRILAWMLVGSLPLFHASAQAPEHSGIDRLANALAKKSLETSFRTMNRPMEPIRLIDNISYVGAREVSSFLITTPQGHILIDSGFAETVPLIRDSVRKLGFRFEDIKILLNSHAHLDHAGGHALVKRLTGARIVMSEPDAELLANGGKGDFLPVGDDLVSYESAKADQIIRDRDQVVLGGVTLTAHMTPGHTKGCTTWTMAAEVDGHRYDVVFFGSTTLLPGVRLADNSRYPAIARDFRKTFRILKSLPCDVFLAPHGSMFALAEKARRLSTGTGPNPFIDPDGYQRFLEKSEQAFLQQWEREQRRPTPAGAEGP